MARASFDDLVDQPYRGKSAAEILALPVDALKGVSAADRQHLDAAFGIQTVEDLATNKFVRIARAIREDAKTDRDPGPDVEWTELFAVAPLAEYRAHPTEFRLDFGPVYYRGRLDGTARVLLVGQDPAANELVGQRAFVGTSGQRLQEFLRRIGIRRDYLLVNTYLYPVFGQFTGALRQLSQAGPILDYRNKLLDEIAKRNSLEAVIAVGSAAKDAVERWPGKAGIGHVQHITHPSAHDHASLLDNWNLGLAALRAAVDPEKGIPVDTSTYGTDFVSGDQIPLPRRDLPFGMPEWHGDGTHATRARNADNTTDHKGIIWKAP